MWGFIIAAIVALAYVARDAWRGDLSDPWRIARNIGVAALGLVLLLIR